MVLPAGAYRHRATGRGLPGRGVRLQAQGPHLSSLHRGQGLRYDHQRVLQVGAPHKPFMERFKLSVYTVHCTVYTYQISSIKFTLLVQNSRNFLCFALKKPVACSAPFPAFSDIRQPDGNWFNRKKKKKIWIFRASLSFCFEFLIM